MIVTSKKTGKKKDVRLPKRFKAKWLEALRSGKFKQGKHKIHDREKDLYCCIGVACRLEHPRKDFGPGGLISTSDTKNKVPEILKGLINKDKEAYNPIVDKLTLMNDEGGKSFVQIANWIEKNL